MVRGVINLRYVGNNDQPFGGRGTEEDPYVLKTYIECEVFLLTLWISGTWIQREHDNPDHDKLKINVDGSNTISIFNKPTESYEPTYDFYKIAVKTKNDENWTIVLKKNEKISFTYNPSTGEKPPYAKHIEVTIYFLLGSTYFRWDPRMECNVPITG